MKLFGKRKAVPSPAPFPLGQFEPVLRSSICTGETTACMRNRETGKLHEIMLIRNSDDLDRFGRMYGIDTGSIRTVY